MQPNYPLTQTCKGFEMFDQYFFLVDYATLGNPFTRVNITPDVAPANATGDIAGDGKLKQLNRCSH